MGVLPSVCPVLPSPSPVGEAWVVPPPAPSTGPITPRQARTVLVSVLAGEQHSDSH
jgi:hypothetical protein